MKPHYTVQHPDLRIEVLTGEAIQPHLSDLARLRIEVFREYPYLYDGSFAYEADYLSTFAADNRSIFVLAVRQPTESNQEPTVIGVATGLPLDGQHEEFTQPFIRAGIDPATVFYFSESVLLPEFRGHGVGTAFLRAREDHASSLQHIRLCAFCSVERPENHPMKPTNHKPLDGFWERCGFVKRPELQTQFSWKEVAEDDESPKTMTFWIKPTGEI